MSIIATDLSRAALERAASGRHTPFEVQRGLPPARVARHFERDGKAWVIDRRLKAQVEFRPLKLLEGCREIGRCDIVFLRNVLIYFDLETRRRVLDDVAAPLAPDGYLFLGGTETVLGVSDAFQPLPGRLGCFRPAVAPIGGAVAFVMPRSAAALAHASTEGKASVAAKG